MLTAQEVRDRAHALKMAEDLCTSPQCIRLYVRHRHNSYAEIPVVTMCCRGGDMRRFERDEQAIMIALEKDVMEALDRAREEFLTLALGAEEA